MLNGSFIIAVNMGEEGFEGWFYVLLYKISPQGNYFFQIKICEKKQ